VPKLLLHIPLWKKAAGTCPISPQKYQIKKTCFFKRIAQ
jgi:hypothetical protein